MNKRKTIYLSIVALFLIVCLHPLSASSAPLDNWHVRNSVPGGYTLNAVAYGNGMFVAVGSGGTILSSPDGAAWTPQASGTTAVLYGVAYGNGLFVVVGDLGTVLTSPDGANWSEQTSGVTSWLGGIAYGNGVFVAGGSLTSHDGVNWTVISEQGGGQTRFGDDTFLMLGLGSSFSRSPDGINWSHVPGAGYSGAFSDILLHNGTYVLVGIYLAPGFNPSPLAETILTSTDGTTWTPTCNINPSTHQIMGITHGSGYFVAVGSPVNGMSSARIYVSTDAMSWHVNQINELPGSPVFYSLVYGNHSFVVVGENGLIIQSDALPEVVGVPTLSEWGMILLVISFGIAAIRSLQNNKPLKQY